jgi:hypothetical protein
MGVFIVITAIGLEQPATDDSAPCYATPGSRGKATEPEPEPREFFFLHSSRANRANLARPHDNRGLAFYVQLLFRPDGKMERWNDGTMEQ